MGAEVDTGISMNQSLRYTAIGRKIRKILWLKNWPAVIGSSRLGMPLPSFNLRSGIRITHGPEDIPNALFEEIFLMECYTRDGFYIPRANDCVVDIGGNIGVFALFLQSHARGIRVHSFEPAQSNRDRYERNITENGLSEFVRIHPYGIMDRECEIELHHAGVSGNHTLYGEQGAVEKVRCIPLEDALKKTGEPVIHLLKMDIEGAEVEALGQVSVEALAPVQRVAMEYHENIRPGSLALIREKLRLAGLKHQILFPDPDGSGLGILQASRARR